MIVEVVFEMLKYNSIRHLLDYPKKLQFELFNYLLKQKNIIVIIKNNLIAQIEAFCHDLSEF